jgi:hypothetical protein
MVLISQEAHENLAIAMNRMVEKATLEKEEDPKRFKKRS